MPSNPHISHSLAHTHTSPPPQLLTLLRRSAKAPLTAIEQSELPLIGGGGDAQTSPQKKIFWCGEGYNSRTRWTLSLSLSLSLWPFRAHHMAHLRRKATKAKTTINLSLSLSLSHTHTHTHTQYTPLTHHPYTHTITHTHTHTTCIRTRGGGQHTKSDNGFSGVPTLDSFLESS